ncbi:Uncharacterised protein [Neisseria meningitidis]|nr:Uncharacterised protein [Neisseria meningitidis]CWT25654.1 Uncharacterised protein [Neisseria meningitidis]
MLARIVGFKAVFAAQFPAGFLGNSFAQHLTPAFVFNGTQGFDACRRFADGSVGVKLNRHIRAANQFYGFTQRHIAFACAVGFNSQTVVIAQNSSHDIAHILRQVRLTVAAVDRTRVGVAVSSG